MAQKLNMHRGAYYYYYDFAKPKKTKKHKQKNIPESKGALLLQLGWEK